MSQPSGSQPDVSVVVPVYGGEKSLQPLSEQLLEVAAQRGWQMEILFICDRPRDQSWQVASRLARETPQIQAALLMRNFGQHPATLLGIRMARGRIIATMDEDLQHNPQDLPALVEAAQANQGIAYGIPHNPQHARWRNATSWLAKWFLSWYIDARLARSMSAFRAFDCRLRRAFQHYRGERVAIDVLLSWTGAPIDVLTCQHAPRLDNESGYTWGKLIKYLGDLWLSFSVAPLRFASMLGLGNFFFAVVLGAYVFIKRVIQDDPVPGFAFLALFLAILGGSQLLALGVIGEYLGRMYFNDLKRPQYLVSQVEGRALEPFQAEEL